MQPLQTARPHAGVHEVSNSGPGSGPSGNGYALSILPKSPICQQPTARTCYAQVAYHLAMAEQWLDLATAAEVGP